MEEYPYLISKKMVKNYEELRSNGLAGNRRSHNLGMALFRHRGMAAWMKVMEDYSPASQMPHQEASDDKVQIPAELRGNIVMVLVSMALDVRKEKPV